MTPDGDGDLAADVAPDGSGADGSDDCTAESILTVSGGLVGARLAPAASANWSGSNDVSSVSIDALFGTPFQASLAFTFTGEPLVKTYAETTPDVGCGVTVSDPAVPNSGWAAEKGVAGGVVKGTCLLTIASVRPTLIAGGLRQYCVHGTIQATLPMQGSTPSTGTVSLSASF